MARTLHFAAVLALTRPVFAQLPPTPREPDAAPKPQLHVAQRSQDLGAVVEGDKVTVTWPIENRGKADLVIERTVASCGCTVVQLLEEEKTIRPGQTLNLKAQFDSTARRDIQVKHVTVHSNDAAEPELRLEFKAKVELLFELDPVGMVNLRAIRRGQSGPRTLDLWPGAGRKSLTIQAVDLPADSPLTYQVEPFEGKQGPGQRIRFTVAETAPLGQLNAVAMLKVTVDGMDRERQVPIRGEVVADLTWLPKVLDVTRQASMPGKRLAPIAISSPEKLPFEVLSADAGPLFQAAVEPRSENTKTEYNVILKLREDAAPGPFGTLLKIRTTSLDQPLVEIPVFGIVAASVEIEPAVVLLRDDGTPAGARRRLRVQAAAPSVALDITGIECDNPAVSAVVDREASSRYTHIRFLDVRLAGKPEGRPSATLKLTTSVVGAERLEVPVVIDAGKPKPD
jgi:hypothetical protein